MHHFYKLISGNLQTALMTAIMQKQDEFSPLANGAEELRIRIVAEGGFADTSGATVFPALKRLALAVAQMTDAVQLRTATLLRIASAAPEFNLVLDVSGSSAFALFLHALEGAVLLAGVAGGEPDEAIDVISGDVWWYNARNRASLINRSRDEVFMLKVEVQID